MKMYLAGCDVAEFTRIAVAGGATHLLASYWTATIKQNGIDAAVEWARLCHSLHKEFGVKFMLDSGLFTMMYGTNKTYTHSDMVDYTKRYLDFIDKTHWCDFGHVVEMDVHRVTGMKSLAALRKMFVSAGISNSTVFVWHAPEGFDGWKSLVKKYPYVALAPREFKQVFEGERERIAFIQSMLTVARKIDQTTQIHLLGTTKRNMMAQSGYDSLDSTSWLSCAKHGEQKVIINGTNKVMHIDSEEFAQAVRPRQADIVKRLSDVGYTFTTIQMSRVAIACTLSAERYIDMNKQINKQHYPNDTIREIWK